MIRFRQIIECMVEHTPAGRRNGIDCVEVSRRGLLAISEDGDLFRFDYKTKVWWPQSAELGVVAAPTQPGCSPTPEPTAT